MNELKRAFLSECLKLKHLNMIWITFIAFSLGPIFGGLLMFLLQNPELVPKSGIISTKLSILSTLVGWGAYFSMLSQVMAIGGVIVFGFVASYIFGREYVDRTYRDLLSLPISRTHILNAKFIVYVIWCLCLTVFILVLGFIIAGILKLPGWEYSIIFENIITYLITALLTMALGTLIAFFALWSKGFLAPLGFLVLTLIFAQLIPIVGWGYYFPWSIPSIYCGAAGEVLKSRLNEWSYLSLIFTSFAGYILSIAWWKYSDQT